MNHTGKQQCCPDCRRAYKREWMRRYRGNTNPAPIKHANLLEPDEIMTVVAAYGDLGLRDIAALIGVGWETVRDAEQNAIRKLWRNHVR